MRFIRTIIAAIVFAVSARTAAQQINSPPQIREQLARAYCQTCHLFPEPALLDKQSWTTALKRMAPFLGAAKLNYENKPDGSILKEAGIFPSTPLISEQDWRAISQFYNDNAPSIPLPQKPQPQIERNLRQFKPHPLRYPGATHVASLVRIQPGKSRVFVGNAITRSLDLISLEGALISRVALESAPVDLSVRPEGIYLTLIGNLFPSDERNGKIVLLTYTNGVPLTRTILDRLSRPTSASFADLNRDGREDLVLCSFGNFLGKLSWYERNQANEFSEHLLLEQPGAVNSVVLPARNNNAPEIYVLTAQAREGLHRFIRSKDSFQHEVILEFHPAFGSSHLEVIDMNKDGFPDLLVTNGDNGDYPSHLKNYHGVRLYLNDGKGTFREHWFYALNGAYKAVPGDFDGDGNIDIAAISFFPDYIVKPQESFVLFRNNGEGAFTPASFEGCTSGRWLTMDAGDVDGDGDLDIVLGSFAEGPASIPVPPDLQQSWRTNGFSVLWLENQSR